MTTAPWHLRRRPTSPSRGELAGGKPPLGVPCRSDRGTGPVAIITLCGGGLSAGGTVSMSAGEKLGAPRPTSYAVLETRGSAALLRELEVSNLFVVPLDDHRQWYRYHQLFADLLCLQLGAREPELVPVLHRRAAAWHRQAGNVDEAIGHASAAGELSQAGALIAQHWLTYWRRGRRATVARWLQGLPQETITADPPVAFVAAWIS